jgi:hypothetical protein
VLIDQRRGSVPCRHRWSAAIAALACVAGIGCGSENLGDAPDVQGLPLDTAKQLLKQDGYQTAVTDDAMFGVIIESHFIVCEQSSPRGKLVPLEVSKDC